MGKCKRCGKKGLFLKVTDEGLCNDCVSLQKRETDNAHLQKEAERLQSLISGSQKIYEDIKAKAIEDGQTELRTVIALKETELSILNQNIDIRQKQLESLNESVAKSEKAVDTAAKKVSKLKSLYKSIDYAINHFLNPPYETELVPDADAAFEELLAPTVELKLNCMDVKQLRAAYKQNQKSIQEVLEKYQGRYTTKANIAIYRLMVIALEAELQNVLYNIGYGKLDNSLNDIRSITQKYLKIATDGNQSIVNTVTKFIGEIEYLFMEAVKIEYEYYVQKERMKEEQRALREQMRQEAEDRRILEQQKKQVEKEEQKYRNEITSLQEQLTASDESSKNEKYCQLEARIAELQAQLAAVETKKEEIIALQNGKAGYVYVISNLGSFGDHVFKIGMTRRQEPEERVKELGDASVPFPFDIHSLIFSDDAVGLEHSIHQMLNARRLNKVNLRKEFFDITIDELEALVYSLQPSAEFKRTMLAEQYYQSLSIANVPELHQDVFSAEDDDED